MSNFEKQIKENVIFDGKILKLVCDDVQLQNGAMAKREIVHHHGGAAVLLVDNGKVLLVKQFRYSYGKELYEIPAGKLEENEDEMIAAARELEEETGYRAKLQHLMDIYPTPGYADEIIHIYLAKEFERAKQHLDENEFLDVVFKDLDEVEKMISNGEICDAKTVCAVLKYLSLCKSV